MNKVAETNGKQSGSKTPASEPRTKVSAPVPSAVDLEQERRWVQKRVEGLFESDPGGETFLRRVVGATQIDLDIMAYAVSNIEVREGGIDLERVMIILHNRLDAALDLDEYFSTGRRYMRDCEEFAESRRVATASKEVTS
jgi:hypothetical protein